MKKLVLSIVFCVLCLPVFAAIDQGAKSGSSNTEKPLPKFGVNGIASGSVELDLLMGVNNQINKYERDETSLTGESVDYGTNSFDIGGNLLYYISPVFALGFSFSYTGLNNSNYNLYTHGTEYSLYQEE